jgi:cobalt-zinc-cadmium efflux system membrane fusion protein
VVILSQDQASVTAKVPGSIDEIFVLEGQKLAKGQPLMKLASPEYVQLQEDYLRNVSEMKFLEADFKRQQGLRAENVVGEKEFQLVRSKYEAADTRLKASSARLLMLGVSPESLMQRNTIDPYYLVRSPIQGYLNELPVSIGLSVTATTELAHVLNMEKFHADIFVFEKDVDVIHEGQAVDLSFANTSLKPVQGRVEFIAPEIDPVKRSVVVHVVFDTPKGTILPDMTVTASFVHSGRSVASMPLSAVLNTEGGHFVYVAGRGKTGVISFTRHAVTTGMVDGEWVEVTDLPEGTEVVSKGKMLLEGESRKSEMEE